MLLGLTITVAGAWLALEGRGEYHERDEGLESVTQRSYSAAGRDGGERRDDGFVGRDLQGVGEVTATYPRATPGSREPVTDAGYPPRALHEVWPEDGASDSQVPPLAAAQGTLPDEPLLQRADTGSQEREDVSGPSVVSGGSRRGLESIPNLDARATPDALRALAVAYWPEDPATALRVLECESSTGQHLRTYDLDAANGGPYQISRAVWKPYFESRGIDWADVVQVPATHFQAAREIYDRAGGWSPWSCY